MASNTTITRPLPHCRPAASGAFIVLVLVWLMLIIPHSSLAFNLQRLDIQQGSQTLSDVIILDARPHAVWQQGHLPGAHVFSWEDYTRVDADGVKYRIAPPDELARALGALGIERTSSVLIYGDADSSWGGEGWLAWMLAWLGHEGPVFLLDGGIQAWKKAQLPLSTTVPPQPQAVPYRPQLQPQYTISADQIAQQSDSITLIDTRNYWLEWLPGHLPQAVHLDWKSLYHSDDKRPLDGAAFKQLLQQQGVDLSKPVVYYCTGGIRSAYAWMVHQLAGLPSAVNFEGGTEEWNHFQAQQPQ